MVRMRGPNIIRKLSPTRAQPRASRPQNVVQRHATTSFERAQALGHKPTRLFRSPSSAAHAIRPSPASPPIVQRQSELPTPHDAELTETVHLDDEAHTLYAAPVDGSIELMLASSPQLLTRFLTQLRAKEAYTNLEAGEEADSPKAQVDAHLARIEALTTRFDRIAAGWKLIQDPDNPGQPHPNRQGLGRALGEVQTTIADQLQQAGTANLPATQTQFGPVVNYGGILPIPRGQSVQANTLSLRPGNTSGSEPHTPYPGIYGNYVKGHLLNHHLHGPAEPRNLVPMSRAMNGSFENAFESYVKDKVLAEHRVVALDVHTVEEEPAQVIPRAVEFTARELERDGDGQWVPKDQNPFRIEGQVAQDGGTTITQHSGSAIADGRVAGGPQNVQILGNQQPPDNALGRAITEHRALTHEWSEPFGQVLGGLLRDIANEIDGLRLIAADLMPAPLPRTRVTFGDTIPGVLDNGGASFEAFGTSMLAHPLSLRPGDTSGFEPPQAGRYAPYIQGHMLNHHLHGPGTSENFLPMTASANQQFERSVESLAKQAVLVDNHVVRFEVTGENLEESESLTAYHFREEDYEDSAEATARQKIQDKIDAGNELADQPIHVTRGDMVADVEADIAARHLHFSTDEGAALDEACTRFQFQEPTFAEARLALTQRIYDQYVDLAYGGQQTVQVPRTIYARLSRLRFQGDDAADPNHPDEWEEQGAPLFDGTIDNATKGAGSDVSEDDFSEASDDADEYSDDEEIEALRQPKKRLKR